MFEKMFRVGPKCIAGNGKNINGNRKFSIIENFGKNRKF